MHIHEYNHQIYLAIPVYLANAIHTPIFNFTSARKLDLILLIKEWILSEDQYVNWINSLSKEKLLYLLRHNPIDYNPIGISEVWKRPSFRNFLKLTRSIELDKIEFINKKNIDVVSLCEELSSLSLSNKESLSDEELILLSKLMQLLNKDQVENVLSIVKPSIKSMLLPYLL